jgi:hypothetical protein
VAVVTQARLSPHDDIALGHTFVIVIDVVVIVLHARLDNHRQEP